MPLQDHMKLISIDDHVIEHPNVWADRLPAQYREVGPRIVEFSEDAVDDHGMPIPAGAQIWTYEGRRYNRMALDAVAGKKREEFSLDPYRYDQIIPGCYDPAARVRDIDEDGIWAQLCFPTFPRFAGTLFLESKDFNLALECVRAYNDFIVDEWCGYAPERQIPMMIIPLWDTALAVAEIERAAGKGAKAITFVENPDPLGLPSFHTDHWDPVFAVAEEAGLPLCLHFGTSGAGPRFPLDAPFTVPIALCTTNSMCSVVDMLFSPMFHKFPRLKVAMSEGGIGWVPYVLERADYTWERHRYYTGVNTEVRPSDLFRQNITVCFIEDHAGIRERHAIGLDRITWECDYPHSDSNWPHARKRLGEQLVDVPDDEAHMIVELNARRLLQFDL